MYNHPVLQSQVFSEKKEEETKTCKKHINDKNIKKKLRTLKDTF